VAGHTPRRRRGYALIWTDNSGREREYLLEGPVTVGRAKGDFTYQVIIKPEAGDPTPMGVQDPTVSRVHARLEPGEGGVLVWDVGTRGRGSTNGTYINGARVEPGKPALAKPGDKVRFGNYTIVEVGSVSGSKVVRVLAAGTTVILSKDEAARLPATVKREVSVIDEEKVAVRLDSREVPSSTLDLGEKGARIVRVGEAERLRADLSNLMRFLVDALRHLERGGREGQARAAAIVKAVGKIPAYRAIIVETLGAGELLEELEAVAGAIQLGRAPEGAQERLRLRIEELSTMVEMMMAAPHLPSGHRGE